MRHCLGPCEEGVYMKDAQKVSNRIESGGVLLKGTERQKLRQGLKQMGEVSYSLSQKDRVWLDYERTLKQERWLGYHLVDTIQDQP